MLGESPLSAAELLALMARLPEGSMYVAMQRDREHWREYLDVGPDHYALAGIYNAVNENTRGTGSWARGKAPKFQPWPTPALLVERAQKRAERKTVAGLFAALAGGAIATPHGGLIEEE